MTKYFGLCWVLGIQVLASPTYFSQDIEQGRLIQVSSISGVVSLWLLSLLQIRIKKATLIRRWLQSLN